jgi:hypothetical protein
MLLYSFAQTFEVRKAIEIHPEIGLHNVAGVGGGMR